MLTLLPYIDNCFLPKRSRLKVFSDEDVRLEGWFKGELLFLFNRLRQQDRISSFQPEVPLNRTHSRARIDFEVRTNRKRHVCELKCMCTSQARGTPRNLNFYFQDDHVGIIRDFRRLQDADCPDKWVLAFVYPKPSREQWQEAITRIPQALSDWQCVSDLGDYPDHLFISLWKC